MLKKAGSKILGLFVETTPNGSTEAATESEAAPTVKATSSVTARKPDTVDNRIVLPPAVAGQPSDQYLNMLADAIQAADQEGYDYLEFRQGVQNAINNCPDERTRFILTFDMAAKPANVTRQMLIDSTQHYLEALDKEATEFLQAIVQMTMKAIQDSIVDQTEIAPIRAKLKEEDERLSILRSQFDASVTVIRMQITGDLEKIKTYLPEPEKEGAQVE